MATKCIVLGQDTEQNKELKPIRLKECLQQTSGDWAPCAYIDNTYFDFFQLNPSYKIKGMDLITTRSVVNGYYEVWLGYWNDGVA